jgi:hypothetical protein
MIQATTEEHQDGSSTTNTGDEDISTTVFRSPRLVGVEISNNNSPSIGGGNNPAFLKNPFAMRSQRSHDYASAPNANEHNELETVEIEVHHLQDNDDANPTFQHRNPLFLREATPNEAAPPSAVLLSSPMIPRKDWSSDERSEGGESSASSLRSGSVALLSFCPSCCRRHGAKIGLSVFAVLIISLAIAFGVSR